DFSPSPSDENLADFAQRFAFLIPVEWNSSRLCARYEWRGMVEIPMHRWRGCPSLRAGRDGRSRRHFPRFGLRCWSEQTWRAGIRHFSGIMPRPCDSELCDERHLRFDTILAAGWTAGFY